jgi:hypothetical protein
MKLPCHLKEKIRRNVGVEISSSRGEETLSCVPSNSFLARAKSARGGKGNLNYAAQQRRPTKFFRGRDVLPRVSFFCSFRTPHSAFHVSELWHVVGCERSCARWNEWPPGPAFTWCRWRNSRAIVSNNAVEMFPRKRVRAWERSFVVPPPFAGVVSSSCHDGCGAGRTGKNRHV